MGPTDILLYSGTFWDARLIQWRTRSTYNHVEVAISSRESVAALNRGVVRHTPPCPARIYSLHEDLMLALRWPQGHAWLSALIGHEYGWLDVVDAGLKMLLPDGPFIFRPDHVDCSHLTATFLQLQGYYNFSFASCPQAVTPADIDAFCQHSQFRYREPTPTEWAQELAAPSASPSIPSLSPLLAEQVAS